MADAELPTTSALATRSGRDVALAAALDRLAPGRPPDRPDTPDQHVTAVRRLPAIAATYAEFPPGLDPRLCRALASRGVTAPYTHQAAAIEHALAGRNVVVITPTASGKTLCYNGPVLHSILEDPSSRALYLFPTKALAQDQLAELQTLCEIIDRQSDTPIGVFTYDGDTPQDARRTIRGRAHVVLSNPDMVHSGILPHHPRWAKLFENLRYVIIDELHAYRGVFGSHLCNVLRRLRRICRHYGSNPVFLCSSATIANPRELAERLTERPFEADREERRPARREVLRVRQSAGGQSPARDPPFVPQRDAANRLGVPQAEPAADRLCPEPAVDRDPHDLPERRFRRDPRPGGADPRLSRRIPAESAPGDRKGAARGSGPCRRVHQRAGARDRHRRPRRCGDGRLPGNDRRDVAAGGTRRPPLRSIGGGDGRLAARRSISSSSGTRRISSTVRRSARSSIPTTSTSSSITSSARRSSCRSLRARSSGGTTSRRFWPCLPSRASCTGAAARTIRTGPTTRSGRGRANRIQPTPSASDRCRRTTS